MGREQRHIGIIIRLIKKSRIHFASFPHLPIQLCFSLLYQEIIPTIVILVFTVVKINIYAEMNYLGRDLF